MSISLLKPDLQLELDRLRLVSDTARHSLSTAVRSIVSEWTRFKQQAFLARIRAEDKTLAGLKGTDKNRTISKAGRVINTRTDETKAAVKHWEGLEREVEQWKVTLSKAKAIEIDHQRWGTDQCQFFLLFLSLPSSPVKKKMKLTKE